MNEIPNDIKARAAEQVAKRVSAPSNVVPMQSPASEAKPIKFQFEMASSITITSSPEWAIDGLLPKQGLAAVYGPPGSGKSFLTIDAVGHIAAGLEWCGRQVEQGGVVYVAAEAGTGLRKRLAAWRKGHTVAGSFPLALVSVAPNMGTTKDGNDTLRLIDDLRAQAPALGFPISVIVIDTLARAMYGADENSASDMGAFIANAGLVADAFKCLVVAVHHSGKDAERGMRGSSALHGACDAEWEIKEIEGTEKGVTLVKLKEGEDGLAWRFRLNQTVVFDPLFSGGETTGKVSAGDAVTSCTVEITAEPKHSEKKRRPRVPSGAANVVFEAIREAIAIHGTAMPQTSDYPSCNGVTRDKIKTILYAKGFGNAEKPDSQRAQFNNLLTKLNGDGYVKTQSEWVWLCD